MVGSASLLPELDAICRLPDWGWSCQLLQAAWDLAGTFLYMSPEILTEVVEDQEATGRDEQAKAQEVSAQDVVPDGGFWFRDSVKVLGSSGLKYRRLDLLGIFAVLSPHFSRTFSQATDRISVEPDTPTSSVWSYCRSFNSYTNAMHPIPDPTSM